MDETKELLFSAAIFTMMIVVVIHFLRRPPGTPFRVSAGLWLFYACLGVIVACTIYGDEGKEGLFEQSFAFYGVVVLHLLTIVFYTNAAKRVAWQDGRYHLLMIPTAVACGIPIALGWSGVDIAFVAVPALMAAVCVDYLLRRRGIVL